MARQLKTGQLKTGWTDRQRTLTRHVSSRGARALTLVPAVLYLLLQSAPSTYGASGDELPLDLTITMHRHGCEKRCPVYKVIVFGDGTSIVVGEHYVKAAVLDKVTLTSTDVERLVDAFTSVDYFHLQDVYGYREKGCASTATSDAQVVVTTIVMNGNGHSITHHHGCEGAVSERLTSLENTIDQVARSARRLNMPSAAKR